MKQNLNESETYEHEIVVDKYITVLMKIPRKIDAISLRGLMQKSLKLFNLSEIEVERTEKKHTKTFFYWSEEQENALRKLVGQAKQPAEITNILNEQFNLSLESKQVMNKIRNAGIK